MPLKISGKTSKGLENLAKSIEEKFDNLIKIDKKNFK